MKINLPFVRRLMPVLSSALRLLLFAGLLLVPALSATAGRVEAGVFPQDRPETVPAPATSGTTAPAAGCPEPFCLNLPTVRIAGTTGTAGWVQTQDRAAVKSFYLGMYLSSENVPDGWTGNLAACSPGTTSVAFQAAIFRRINYFRSMAGVPGIGSLSQIYNIKAQAAALMMSVNRSLSHTPPASWTCYTADGAQAAGSSNLFLGDYGPSAITGHIQDPGTGNSAAGHRRWVLFPPTQQMGTGDIPGNNGYPPANDLWVFDTFSPRPATRQPYVAWPPPGYAPYQVVFARWSFSYPGADFNAATVTMQSGGAGITVTLSPVANGYGDNTLVWTPASGGDPWPKPAQDTKYTVTVHNVMINGEAQSFTYDVIVFDPGT